MIGRNPKTNSDAVFQDWIAGDQTEKTLGEFVINMINEFKEGRDPEKIQHILMTLKNSNPPETYRSWIMAFRKMMPPDYPIQAMIMHEIHEK